MADGTFQESLSSPHLTRQKKMKPSPFRLKPIKFSCFWKCFSWKFKIL